MCALCTEIKSKNTSFYKEICVFSKKNTQIIWSYQKKAVPLQPISRMTKLLTNGIKAITSDFGSENLGSIPGWSTKEARMSGFF